MIRHFLFTILTFIVLITLANGQDKLKISDTESRVAELENFHEVMYPIWHTEYPANDYSALRGHKSEVITLAEKIYAANLPGILRDKKEKWQNGMVLFKKAVDEYSLQVIGDDNGLLMKAVENMHTQYEGLVRIIRPVLNEVDQFHKVLYVIYHTHLPAKNYAQINSLSSDLVLKAQAITKAVLPAKLSDKEKDFRSAAYSLLNASIELQENNRINKDGNTSKFVENIHSKYQRLEEIF